MPFYCPGVDDATDDIVVEVFAPVPESAVKGQPVVGPPAGMVAVRVADLVDTGRGGGGALVAAEVSPVTRGETVVFCAPVVIAPAVLRRDGRVQAGGWLPDQVRLGVLEHHVGVGAIEELVADAGLGAKPGVRRRSMSLELAARFVLAMVLLPEASYRR